MKVNICGVPYTIISRQDQFDTEIHFGMIDHLDCKIVVNEKLNGQNRSETICHEILHGILTHIGKMNYLKMRNLCNVWQMQLISRLA